MRKQFFLTAVLALAGVSSATAQLTPPAVNWISPSWTLAGSPAFTLTVYGSNLLGPSSGCSPEVPQSLIVWNGIEQPDTSPGGDIPMIQTVIPAAYVATAGTASVKVRNRSCALGLPPSVACTCTTLADSNVVDFAITLPLVASCNNPPQARAGVAYTHRLSASGGVPPYIWMPATALPPQLTLAEDGTITGVFSASDVGVVNFSATVLDSVENSQTINCQIVVVVVPPLTASCNNPPQATVGVPYSHRLVAGGGLPPYVWTTASIAPGVSLAADGSISGVFSASAPPAVSFTASVRDAALQVTQVSCQIAVVAPPALTASCNNPPQATVGVPYNHRLVAGGGVPPYVWTTALIAPGVSLAADGSISGVFSASAPPAVSFTASVRDAALQVTPISCQIPVRPPLVASCNNPPQARAGVAYTHQLSASGGSPPYVWTAVTMPPQLTLASDGTVSGVLPASAAPAVSFTASVRDAALQVTQVSCQIGVGAAPALTASCSNPPQATIGVPYNHRLVAGGGVPPYVWTTALIAPQVSLAADGSISGVFSASDGAAVSFTASVRDAALQVTPISCQIPIKPPLVASCNNPPQARAGVAYSHRLSASGGTPPYRWTAVTMPPQLTLASDGTVSGVLPASAAPAVNFTATVWDSVEDSQTISCQIGVGTAPALTASCNNPPQATVGVPYSHRLVAGGGVPPNVWTTALIAPQVSLAADGSISGVFSASDAPAVSFTASVRDAAQQVTRISCQIQIAATPTPIITGYNPSDATACGPGFTLSVSGSYFQPGVRMEIGGPVGYQPLATNFIGSSLLAATVLRDQIMTPAPVSIVAVNQSSTGAQFVRSDPRPFSIRRTPRIQTLTPARATVGSADLPMTVTGADFAAGVTRVLWQAGTATESLAVTRWSTVELGVVIPQRLLAFTGWAQIRVVNVEAANPSGMVYPDTCSFPASFSVESTPLVMDTTQLPPGKVGIDYRTALPASGGTGPYRFSLLSGSAPGLTFAADGVLSGRPTQAGSFSLRMQVSDASFPQQTVQRDLSLRVDPADLAVSAPSSLADGRVGVGYNATFTATGGTPPYRWEMLSESPAATGLTLGATGVLSGRPQRAGSFTLRVRVSDASSPQQTVQRDLTLRVDPPDLAVSAPASLADGRVGVGYNEIFTATGGTPPYRWEMLSESPAATGLTLGAIGLLGGRPQRAGSFTLRVQVSDSSPLPLRAQRDYTLAVSASDLAVSGPSTLPAATAGATYSVTFTANGGTAPYQWTLASGAVEGLALAADGTLGGTPTRDGSFAIVVRVTDANAQQATREYTIQVRLPNVAATLTAPVQPSSPTDQPAVTMSLAAVYPAALQGQLRITFAPNADGLPAAGYMDPALRFAAGGTTLDFSVPAGSTTVPLPQNGAIQLGSVAGIIAVSLEQLRVSGTSIDVPTPSRPSVNIMVPRQAPVIIANSVQIAGATSSGFSVELDGYSTPRDLRSVTFTFSAASGSQLGGQVAHTVQLSTESAAWFASTDGRANGSRFHLRVPFTLSGTATALGSVSVTLENSIGVSTPVSGGVR